MNLYKGQRQRMLLKNVKENTTLIVLPQVIKCSKCNKYNSIYTSPEIKNTCNCYFCGNPCYIIKTNN